MRYDVSTEGESSEMIEELSDAFETGLQTDSFESEGETFDTEAYDSEMFDSESFDQEAFDSESADGEFADFEGEGEGEGESEAPGRAGVARRSGGGSSVQRKLQQQRAALAQLRSAVQSVGRHIRKDGPRLRFTLPARTLRDASVRLRVNPALVSALLKSLKKTNAQPQSLRREQETELDEMTMWQEVSGQCPGATKVTRHWWGVAFWLNECHTKALVEAVGVGGTAAAVCAKFAPHPAVKGVCTVAGPVLGLGAAAIKAIDALGGNKGIIIRKPWVSPPGLPVVIWHQ